MAAASVLLSACDSRLDVQQAYPFMLETMPVQKRLAVGETAEIRCTLVLPIRFPRGENGCKY